MKRKKKELAMFICVCLLSSLMMPIVAVASDPEAELGYDPYSILVVIRQDVQGGSTPEDLNSAADYFNTFLSVPNAIIETETLMDYSEPNPDTEDPTDGDGSVPKAIVKLCLSEEGSQKLDLLLDELVTNPFVESAGKNYTVSVDFPPDNDTNNIFLLIYHDIQGGSTPEDLDNAADYFNSFLSVPNAVTQTQELLFIEPDPDADVPTDEDSSVPKSIVKLWLSEEGSQKLDQLLGELLTNPFVALPESPDLFCGENYTLYGMNYLLFANTENMNIGMLKEAALRFDCQLVDANGEPFADDTLPISTGAQIIFPGSNPLMLPPQRVGVLGDGTGDGRVNTADARFALRMAVGLDELERDERYNLSVFVLDTDLSGTVTSSDARTLLRYTVGLEKNLITDWNDAYGDMVRRMIFHDGVE